VLQPKFPEGPFTPEELAAFLRAQSPPPKPWKPIKGLKTIFHPHGRFETLDGRPGSILGITGRRFKPLSY
jgi:hypothetical protein